MYFQSLIIGYTGLIYIHDHNAWLHARGHGSKALQICGEAKSSPVSWPFHR